MKIYQGGFRVATLTEGDIDIDSVDMQTWLGFAIEEGLAAMSEDILPANTRDSWNFQAIALRNVFGSIANSISLAGHGGTVVIATATDSLSKETFKIKYPYNSSLLRLAFIHFINACNRSSELDERREDGEPVTLTELAQVELEIRDALSELTEISLFISHLAGCDGAIVLTKDLRLLGFGCELCAEFSEETEILEVFSETDAINDRGRPLDIEQFGMRHRSAVKLVSQEKQCYALVISQDGPISAVWPDVRNLVQTNARRIYLRKGINFVNANMPWA